MTNLLDSAQVILGDAGFRTSLTTVTGMPALSFENDSVLGFVFVFASPEELVRGWRDIETAFLKSYAPRLTESGDKAWNVYSIFLSSRPATGNSQRTVRWVEENLDRTRKITAAGAASRGELVQA